MKKTRRIAAMIAALAMAATMAVPFTMTASAADVPVTVVTNGSTANEVTNKKPNADQTEHTYTAYQILKGTWTLKAGKTEGSTNDDDYELKVTGLGDAAATLLSNNAFLNFKADDDFGKSIDDTLTALGNEASDAQKAAALAQFLSDVRTGTAKAEELAEVIGNALKNTTGNKIESNTKLAEGYYLITDTYDTAATNSDAVSKFILKVNGTKDTNGIKIIPKKSYPEVIKKVQEDDKATTDYSGEKTALQSAVDNANKWNDVADYCIGEDVPFQLYGSMPETLADYDAYYYNFTDTLGAQFDQPKIVTVKAGNKTLVYTWNATSSAYNLPADDQLKAAAASTVTTYTFKDAATQSRIYAALKTNADYTALPAAEKAAYIHTNWTSLTNAETGALKGLGFTAEADAITATQTTIPAVTADPSTDGNCRVTWDGTNHKLLVSFENVKAYAGVTTSTIVTVNYNAKLNKDAVIGLDGQENKVDLTYSNNPNTEYAPKNDNTTDIPGTNETDTTPEDKVVVFTYEVDINKIDANTKQNLEGAEFSLKSGTTAIKFVDNGDGTYTVADQTLAEGVTTTVKSDANGLFKLVGLDDGTYTLTETKAPDGYPTPTAADFSLVLTATTVNNQAWNGTASSALTAIAGTLNTKAMTVLNSGTVTPNDNTRGTNGGVSGVIENSKSTTLPSTGGMGTILFYTVGGIMVVGAGVVLVTKKRSKNEQ